MSSLRFAVCFPLLLLFASVAYGLSLGTRWNYGETSTPQRKTEREIEFGVTPIRIKHKVDGRYMIVVTRKNWPAATLGSSNLFHYVLYDAGSRGLRVKTLNSTYPGYDYLYSSDTGGLYFDWDRDYGTTDFNEKQYWYLNRSPPLYDGAVVTFRNNWFDDSYIAYDQSASIESVNLFCLRNREDEWILEVVPPQ